MTAKAVVASLLICGTALAVASHPKKKKKPEWLMDNDMGPSEVMDPNCTALGNGYVVYLDEKSNRYGIASTCTGAIADSTVRDTTPPTKHRI